jgi:hypothetical protein
VVTSVIDYYFSMLPGLFQERRYAIRKVGKCSARRKIWKFILFLQRAQTERKEPRRSEDGGDGRIPEALHGRGRRRSEKGQEEAEEEDRR